MVALLPLSGTEMLFLGSWPIDYWYMHFRQLLDVLSQECKKCILSDLLDIIMSILSIVYKVYNIIHFRHGYKLSILQYRALLQEARGGYLSCITLDFCI